jgi:hypothetical protein
MKKTKQPEINPAAKANHNGIKPGKAGNVPEF